MPSVRIILSGGFSFSRRGVAPAVDLPAPASDGLTYVTTAVAARLLGLAPCTITSWKTKEYLKPVAGSPPRRPVYLWDDVLEAEHTARQNALRTSGKSLPKSLM